MAKNVKKSVEEQPELFIKKPKCFTNENFENREKINKILDGIVERDERFENFSSEIDKEIARQIVSIEFFLGEKLERTKFDRVVKQIRLYETVGHKEKKFEILKDVLNNSKQSPIKKSIIEQEEVKEQVDVEEDIYERYKTYVKSFNSKQIDELSEQAKQDARFNGTLVKIGENISKMLCAREVLLIEKFFKVSINKKDANAMFKALYAEIKLSPYKYDIKKEDCLLYVLSKYILKQKAKINQSDDSQVEQEQQSEQ